MTLKAFVVGLPKCATTTIHFAIKRSGLVSAHWLHEKKVVGKEIYKGFQEDGNPLSRLQDVHAVTQSDFIAHGHSLWPQMDPVVLKAVRRNYPDCIFILNIRDPKAAASSICRWGDLQARLDRLGAPGLPKGSATQDGIRDWISSHYGWCRGFFHDDPNFLEYDIADPKAPEIIGEAIGTELKWWGHANINKAS